MTIVRDWNGGDYDRLATPMEAMGRAVVERLPLRGDETVVDAGCGSGRVTQALLDRLPRGRVIAVDGSASMIDAARERLAGEDRVSFVVADLTHLGVDEHLGGEPADAILSTATFHWIGDHALLFERLRRCLRDGGRLVAQCGGAGNIASVHAAARAVGAQPPFAEHLADWAGPWRFAEPGETEDLLRAAGFTSAKAWLQDQPVTPDDPHAYLREINLGAHLQQLPPDLREAFVAAVLERLDAPLTIDYVRLNIDATA